MALCQAFYRLYDPHLHSERMEIPAAFLSQYGDDVPTKFVLETVCGRAFQVYTEIVNEKCFWVGGWPHFVEHCALLHHELLEFDLVEHPKFSVKIFGANGCLKFTSTAEDGSQQSSDMQLQNPNFTCVLTKTNIKRQSITIPADFWKTYLGDEGLDTGARVTLHFQGRTWLASLTILSDRVKIATGNGTFIGDNSFGDGTLCSFYLTDIRPLCFTVVKGT